MKRSLLLLSVLAFCEGCKTARPPYQPAPDPGYIEFVPIVPYWPEIQPCPPPYGQTYQQLISTPTARTHTGTIEGKEIRLQDVHAINPSRVATAVKTAAEKAGFAVSDTPPPFIEANRVTITLAPRTIDNVTFLHRLICTFNLEADTVTIDVSSVGYAMVRGRPTDAPITDQVPREVFEEIVRALRKK